MSIDPSRGASSAHAHPSYTCEHVGSIRPRVRFPRKTRVLPSRDRRARARIVTLIRTAGRPVTAAELLWHCGTSFVPYMAVAELTPILAVMESEGLIVPASLTRVLYDQRRQSYEVVEAAYRLPEPNDEGGAP